MTTHAWIEPHGKHSRIASFEEYQALWRQSLEAPDAFWAAQAERVDWFHPFARTSRVAIDAREAEISWFEGGQLNASHNCIDRHAALTPDKTAILWIGNEPGERRDISFRELQREVCRLANVLRARGVRKGDRVCIYLPMIPEAAFAMLACARIGAVHSVVFAGFSAEALAALRAHPWPGNVRELRNVVERAVYRTDPAVPIEDIVFDPFASPWRPAGAPESPGPAVASAAPPPAAPAAADPGKPYDLVDFIRGVEHDHLKRALEINAHHQKKTADHLGMTYHQLRNYLRKHRLIGR